MKKVATVLGIIFLVALIAIPVSAWGPGWGRGPGSGPSCYQEGYAGFNTNLTADQSAKIQALRETHLKEVTPLRNQLFSKQAELKLLWVQSNPDKNTILSTQKEISDLQYRIKEKSTDYRLEVNKVLTPEQRAQRFSKRHWDRSYPRSGICENYYGRGPFGR